MVHEEHPRSAIAFDDAQATPEETRPTAFDDAQPTEAADDQAGDSPEQPFVGRWNRLVSSTNWEKGRIISQWRQALIDSEAPPAEYSDEAWARHVGGITASHVGRLRRVHDAFAATHETYAGLYWTHFFAALDWDDAPLWLEGAVRSRWSVSAMRRQRWEAHGGDEASRPDPRQLNTDWDEDFDAAAVADGDDTTPSLPQPGQGGGTTKQFDEGPEAIGVTTGPEGPDFGDEDSLNRAAGVFDGEPGAYPAASEPTGEAAAPLVQPFAGLATLPDDLADAVELLKLAILRHKSGDWKEVSADTVLDYLQAFRSLVEAPRN